MIAGLQSRCRLSEARLAAISASCEPNGHNVAAKVQTDAECDVCLDPCWKPSSHCQADWIQSRTIRNLQGDHPPVSLPRPRPLPSSCEFFSAAGLPNGPRDPDDVDGDEGDDDDGDDDDEEEEEEELIQDESPTTGRDIVGSRSLQHAKIDPIPNSAAE